MVNTGRYYEALKVLSGITESSAMADNLRGVCYMMTGDVANAEKFLKRAIAAGSEDAKVNLKKLREQQANIRYK